MNKMLCGRLKLKVILATFGGLIVLGGAVFVYLLPEKSHLVYDTITNNEETGEQSTAKGVDSSSLPVDNSPSLPEPQSDSEASVETSPLETNQGTTGAYFDHPESPSITNEPFYPDPE